MGAIGLLAALMTLGVTVALVLAVNQSQTSPNHDHSVMSIVVPGQTSSARAAGSDDRAASIAVCRTDYAAVSQAVSAYEELTGRPPTSMTALNGMLRDPVGTTQFSIVIDPGHPGKIDVATPDHVAMAGDANCAYA